MLNDLEFLFIRTVYSDFRGVINRRNIGEKLAEMFISFGEYFKQSSTCIDSVVKAEIFISKELKEILLNSLLYSSKSTILCFS